MQIIEIPMFNIKLNISQVAFRIFNIDIYWYAIIIVLAIIIALLYCKKMNNRYNINFETILNISIFAIPIGFIFARIYYVLFKLDYFLEYPLEILNFRNGGIAIYGGIIGGIITTIIYCKYKNINFLDLLDYVAPAIAIAQSIGRWGNFVNVEAYGIETNLPWKMGIVENEIQKFVHPAFFYESICTFIIFCILVFLQKNRKFKGEIIYIYLILYSFARFLIEGIRIDSLMLFNYRISQVLSLAIFIVFSIIFTIKEVKSHKMSKKEIKSRKKSIKN